jgi:hypothetical protein
MIISSPGGVESLKLEITSSTGVIAMSDVPRSDAIPPGIGLFADTQLILISAGIRSVMGKYSELSRTAMGVVLI